MSIPALIFLCIGILYIRKPYFNFPHDEDSGSHTYLPYFRKDGLRLIDDGWALFPNFVTYIFQFIYHFFPPEIRSIRIFSTVYHFLLVYSTYIVVEDFYGTTPALITAFLYGIYASAPYLRWFSVHTENYYLLPALWGIFFFQKALETGDTSFFFLSGAIFCIAFLFKYLIGGYIFVFFFFTGSIVNSFYLSAGFLTIFAAFLALQIYCYWGKNRIAWKQFIAIMATVKNVLVLKYRVGGITFYKGELNNLLQQTAPVWLGVFFLFSEQNPAVMLPWFLATLLILLPQRGYSAYHYLPLVHFMSVLAGVFYSWVFMQQEIVLFKVVVGITLVVLLYCSLKIFVKFYGQKDLRKAAMLFDISAQYILIPEIAKDLKQKLPKGKRFYVWGNLIQLYQLTNTPSIDAYLNIIIKPFNNKYFAVLFDHLMEGFLKHKPEYILKGFHNFDIKTLKELTGIEYRLDIVYYNYFALYKRYAFNETGKYSAEMTIKEKLEWFDKLASGNEFGGIYPYYLENGEYQKGIEEGLKALELNPHDFGNLFYLSALYREAGELDKSMEMLKQISKLKPNEPESYFQQGLLYVRKNDDKAALNSFNTCLEKNQHHTLALYNSASILKKMNKLNEAFVRFQAITQNKEADKNIKGNAYYHLGKVEQELKRKGAEKYFKECLQLNPAHKAAMTEVNTTL
ncbi:MAG: glycosyltransferase family 39 protein [Nitrospinae bacterium]|nr:glycosyltransferase family 39 protein [Nitrospinota bacterium]